MDARMKVWKASEEKFWRNQIWFGFGTMAVIFAGLEIVTIVSTDAAHRTALLLLLGTTTVATGAGTVVARAVAARSWRSAYVLLWCLAWIADLVVCADLDTGLDSHLLKFAALPVLFAAMTLSTRAVILCATLTLSSVPLLAAFEFQITLPEDDVVALSVFFACTGLIAFLLARNRIETSVTRLQLALDLERRMVVDTLTGCGTVAAFQRHLQVECDGARASSKGLHLLLADVDLLKIHNANYGHAAGDRALRQVGEVLRSSVRSEDFVARVGGDKFAIIMPGTTSLEAVRSARALIAAMKTSGAGVGISVGIGELSTDFPTTRLLYRSADDALSDAKVRGRGAVVGPLPPSAADLPATAECPTRATALDRANFRRYRLSLAESDRKRIETEAIVKTLVDDSPVCQAIIDGDLQIVHANAALAHLNGRQPFEIEGRSLRDILPDSWAAFATASRRILGGAGPILDVELGTRTNGPTDDEREWIANLYPLVIAGNTVGLGLAAMDVSDRKALERSRETLTSAIVEVLEHAVELRDPYTAGHQSRVAEIATEISRRMGIASREIRGISLAAAIHDIGKLAIPSEILCKPSVLSSAERSIVEMHSRAGYDIVSAIDFPWPVAEMILHHHERIDGSGYPNGLAGTEIGIGARIIAVADVFEAMSSHRPYRPALGPLAALEFLARQRGRQFDTDVVDACIGHIESSRRSVPRAGEVRADSGNGVRD